MLDNYKPIIFSQRIMVQMMQFPSKIQASRVPDFRYARNALWDYYTPILDTGSPSYISAHLVLMHFFFVIISQCIARVPEVWNSCWLYVIFERLKPFFSQRSMFFSGHTWVVVALEFRRNEICVSFLSFLAAQQGQKYDTAKQQ